MDGDFKGGSSGEAHFQEKEERDVLNYLRSSAKIVRITRRSLIAVTNTWLIILYRGLTLEKLILSLSPGEEEDSQKKPLITTKTCWSFRLRLAP